MGTPAPRALREPVAPPTSRAAPPASPGTPAPIQGPFPARLLCALAALAVACSGPRVEHPPDPSRAAAAPPPPAVSEPAAASPRVPQAGEPAGRKQPLPVISWEEAERYYGRRAVVQGRVIAAKNTGRACFLNFHRNWKRYFTAVIFSDHFDRFPASPETLYLGHTVQVTGQVREYEGKPEIVVDSPEQIHRID